MSINGLIEKDVEYDFGKKVVGMFYIKPNYPGRCSHVSVCNMLVEKKKLNFKNVRFVMVDSLLWTTIVV
jgi:hypothetical protein